MDEEVNDEGDELSTTASQEGEHEDAPPVISILNLVLDHYMSDPTPLSPEEFQLFHGDNAERVQVPVVRVFGPVLRGSATQPVQNGCVHIHNAFPYIICRPRGSGMDSSHKLFKGDVATTVGEEVDDDLGVDWDSVEGIESVIDIIQESLENAISSFDAKEQAGKGDGKDRTEELKIRLVRNIEVVKGRGFYGYCTGGPAPFIKVKYYNPTDRWKMKAIMESGAICGVKFRCFEAHIPYSMQILKDWRCAGFEYIRFSDVRFRLPLPKDSSIADSSPFRINTFNDKNVADCLIWDKVERSTNEFSTIQEENGHPSMSQQKESTVSKDTLTPSEQEEVDMILSQNSCSHEVQNKERIIDSRQLTSQKMWVDKMCPHYKVEFDTSVEAIMNVAESELVERGDRNVHWLAVPSLREMWLEERHRMKGLLPATEDFLSSHNALASFTTPTSEASKQVPHFSLSKPKGSSPSAKAASRGISNLYSSADLARIHTNAIRSIISRHGNKIKVINDNLKEKRCKNISDLDEEGTMFVLDALGKQFPGLESQPFTQGSFSSEASNKSLCFNSTHNNEAVSYTDQFLDINSDSFFDFTQNEMEFGKLVDSDAFAVETYCSKPQSHADEEDEENIEDSKETEESLINDINTLKTRQFAWEKDNGDVHGFTIDYISHSNDDDDDDDDESNAHSLYAKSCDADMHHMAQETTSQFNAGLIEPCWLPPSSSEVALWLLQNHRKKSIISDIDSKAMKNSVGGGTFGSQVVEEVNWHKQSQEIRTKDSYVEENLGSRILKDPASTQNKISKLRPNEYKHYKKNIAPRTLSDSQTSFSGRTQNNGKNSVFTGDPLDVIRNQGGRIHIQGKGGFKASGSMVMKRLPLKPQKSLTIMSIEVHVQCRQGKSVLSSSKKIAMTPDPSLDPVYAVSYVFAKDPGGGESIKVYDQGCLYVSPEVDRENAKSTVLGGPKQLRAALPKDVNVEELRDEKRLLQRIASIIQMKDPDILTSWDTIGSGIGYLIERGTSFQTEINGENYAGIDLARLFGRTPSSKVNCNPTLTCSEADNGGRGVIWKGSGLGAEWDDRVGPGAAAASITGRIVLCGWKICGEEVHHPNVSFQPAVVWNLLHIRLPHHDGLILTRWYGADGGRERWRVLKHRLAQARSTISIFDVLDVIGRAGEGAGLSGVEFSQSFPGIRGSQYKVEGVLLRALQSVWANGRGKKHTSQEKSSTLSASQSQSPWKLIRSTVSEDKFDQGYFFLSPSKKDCESIEALECQAMTLEPQSGFHFDPVVVCDFTALYPSLMIAYNLCFSTCAGKIDYNSTRTSDGNGAQSIGLLGPIEYSEVQTAVVLSHFFEEGNKSQTRAYSLPTGAIFVSESVLKGVLPQVLDEILSTRAMLKRAAKEYRQSSKNVPASILRQLEARQLALKYVANVTYGYTSATFSGRSPMPILADAIVECGRRTLSNAIKLASEWGRDDDNKWSGAEVIYGDTDSIFIKLKDRSVQEAFEFGREFCEAVTASNPPPVQLKLEKVYMPCLLQTKKKYCGMKYESPTDRPTFEGKGIETVRRDQCLLTQKVLRNCLVSLFRSGKDSARNYLFRQWERIHAGQLSISDFILAGRVRSKYRSVGPVQAALARRLAESDPGRKVRHKERQPYVIVASPGRQFKLKDCVLTPLELLEQWDAYAIHATYYAVKHVNAALQRCLGLPPFNIDINNWYDSCPKPKKRIRHWPINRTDGNTAHISYYCISDVCAFCGKKCKIRGYTRVSVCVSCKRDGQSATMIAMNCFRIAQSRALKAAKVCAKCNGCDESSATFGREKISNSSSRSSGVIIPLANCTNIDCPLIYERHRARENGIESLALCKTLDLF